MSRLTCAIALILLLGCKRGKEQAVTIVPHATQTDPDAMPRDPFGASSAAYERLREVTDQALDRTWSGKLEDFGPWLEGQTVAVERSLGLLKALRVGPSDVYAVANGRIALVYEQIATALTEASAIADQEGYEADWRDQQSRIWEQASAFWMRCVRGCSMGGSHLDAWDLRCGHGLARSETKLEPRPVVKSPRQAK
jgi:hypothetical protein